MSVNNLCINRAVRKILRPAICHYLLTVIVSIVGDSFLIDSGGPSTGRDERHGDSCMATGRVGGAYVGGACPGASSQSNN